MTELIRAENIPLAEISTSTSFTVSGGEMVVILTPKDEINASLARILIGLEKPLSGKVFLFGTDIAALSGRELHELRRRIGIAFGSGGLVSNLKAWENLTLPLYYHQHLSHNEIEMRGAATLGRLGFTGKLTALPGHMTASQKKTIGVARAMLVDPDVILYESPVFGLDQEEKGAFFRVAREFHREKPGRASLFITSSHEVLQSLSEAVVVDITKGQIV